MKSKYFFLVLLLCIFGYVNLKSQTLKAVDDTVYLTPLIEKTVYLLANDTIPEGDEILVSAGLGASPYVKCTWHNSGYYTYLVDSWGYNGVFEGGYQLNDLTLGRTSSAKIVYIIGDKSFKYLETNNVGARFNAYGNHFWSPVGPGFFIPKGGGKGTIFSSSFWIGGKGEDSVIYLAAERYRQGPTGSNPGVHADFYAGPVMDSSGYSIYQDTVWNYVWNLNKEEIEFHKAHWNDAGYQPIHDILTWPGNGDEGLGQASHLAPFHDSNQDGMYDPMDGDYPWIRGDQALYFIFNDDRGSHLETYGNKMKIEVHGLAYAYNLPTDSAFNNTIFLNYKIYNRSLRTYFNTYLGVFTDFDIGMGQDDYIGCDVYRSSYFGYNGKEVDGNGQVNAYGSHPPAQSVTFLAGPVMDPIGSDRPRVDNGNHQLCNESITGTGFGDGIPDNERYGMTAFTYTNNGYSGVPPYMFEPSYAVQYYNYLKSTWLDSTHLIYGGNGHAVAGGYGPECRFMFPGESDTLNWGVGCQTPNGEVNWTEVTAHHTPNDVRGLGITGPFTFPPGEVRELDLAFVFARDYISNDTLASVKKLREMIDIIRNAFHTNTLPGGRSFLAVDSRQSGTTFRVTIFPNPAYDKITIVFGTTFSEPVQVRIFNSNGSVVLTHELKPGTGRYSVDLAPFRDGLYLIHFSGNNLLVTKKICLFK